MVTERAIGSVGIVEHFLEPAVRGMGFVLIKDGRSYVPGTNQLKEGNPSFYVKVYQLMIDGHFVDSFVKFIYDMRTGKAKMEFTSPNLIKALDAPYVREPEEVSEW